MHDQHQYTAVTVYFDDSGVVKQALRDGAVVLENKNLSDLLNYIDRMKEFGWKRTEVTEDGQMRTYEFKRLR